jgi:hypothetical protein
MRSSRTLREKCRFLKWWWIWICDLVCRLMLLPWIPQSKSPPPPQLEEYRSVKLCYSLYHRKWALASESRKSRRLHFSESQIRMPFAIRHGNTIQERLLPFGPVYFFFSEHSFGELKQQYFRKVTSPHERPRFTLTDNDKSAINVCPKLMARSCLKCRHRSSLFPSLQPF